MWRTGQYGAEGFRLLVADIILVISQTLEGWAQKLDRLHAEVDPIWKDQ